MPKLRHLVHLDVGDEVSQAAVEAMGSASAAAHGGELKLLIRAGVLACTPQ